MDHEDDINTFRVLAESVLLLAVPLALIYAQPDMKNTITVTIIFCILLYIACLLYTSGIGSVMYFAVPLDMTAIEKRAYYQVANGHWLRKNRVYMVEAPIADAIAMGVDLENNCLLYTSRCV